MLFDRAAVCLKIDMCIVLFQNSELTLMKGPVPLEFIYPVLLLILQREMLSMILRFCMGNQVWYWFVKKA
jgi:hypothetical protein